MGLNDFTFVPFVRDERMSQLWLSKVTYYEDLMT